MDANVRGAGKGLLLDCVAGIPTGERFTVATYTDNEEELRKRITSLALAGERLVLFDNLEGKFGNAVLDAARERTRLDTLTVRKGPRKGECSAKVRPEVRERLKGFGRERALICKTLVLTGMRKGELAALTIAQLHLHEPILYTVLDAADEKNREGNEIL